MTNTGMNTNERPTAAFILSLVAGLWMLSMGGMMGGFGRGMMGGYGGTHGAYHGMGSWMWGSGMRVFGMAWPWFGFVAGILVVIGAALLYTRPQSRRGWGLTVLIVSGLDLLFGMGVLAGVLGVIGGALAMAR